LKVLDAGLLRDVVGMGEPLDLGLQPRDLGSPRVPLLSWTLMLF
jgi:hypothetical protein